MSATQADHALRERIGIGWDVTLVAAGPAIMNEALARGLTVGFVARVDRVDPAGNTASGT